MPRLLRDVQVTTVWEGTANDQALEVLRLLGNRYPGISVFVERVRHIIAVADRRVSDVVDTLQNALEECCDAAEYVLNDAFEAERHARRLMSFLADTMSLALLLEEATHALNRDDARKAQSLASMPCSDSRRSRAAVSGAEKIPVAGISGRLRSTHPYLLWSR